MGFEKSTYQWLKKSDFDAGLHPSGVLLECSEFLEQKKGNFGDEAVFTFKTKDGTEGAMSFWLKSRIFKRLRQTWGDKWPDDWIGKKFKARTVPHTNQQGKDTLVWEYDLSA